MSERDREPPGEAELDREELEALAAWTVPAPPPGFAERVVAARQPAPQAEPEETAPEIPSRTARRRLLPWTAVAAAACGALLLLQLRTSSPAHVAGSAAPRVRETIQLAHRGVAVAEAGAVLSWKIERGQAEIAQRVGDVFYRVERGGRFEVETPRGTVRATGTCFRVELTMKTPWQGVAGAAIGAALVVTVYEGSVLFASQSGGERAVAAGQVLTAGEGGAEVHERGREEEP